jgi:hypothetical protein
MSNSSPNEILDGKINDGSIDEKPYLLQLYNKLNEDQILIYKIITDVEGLINYIWNQNNNIHVYKNFSCFSTSEKLWFMYSRGF